MIEDRSMQREVQSASDPVYRLAVGLVVFLSNH